MRYYRGHLIVLCLVGWLCVVSDAGGQCQTTVLVSPSSNGPLASYTVSIATTDRHCLAGGSYSITTIPPGMVIFPNGIDSFFDIFTEVSTDHLARPIELLPIAPPGMPFQITSNFVFEDPWYPPIFREETVWINPITGIFEFYRPVTPPPEIVPPVMSVGQSACFVVIHKVYTIPLAVPPGLGKPIFTISSGCNPTDPCPDPMACTPGGPYDYRADVVYRNGQWILEFEYSNPLIEPACYCVTYTGNLPPFFDTSPLIGLDEFEQEITVSMAAIAGFPACGELEVFSYPMGAQIESINEPWFFVSGSMTTLAEVEVGRGAFLPGQIFRLVAHVNYSETCADADDEWLIERVLVLPDGRLKVVDFGGECDPTTVQIPTDMDFGESECIEVCHDVYYIQLNTPPDGVPSVSVIPGCGPPCEPHEDCQPGLLENCVYWTERIGSHWYLCFEYSNPAMEPVCYCISYDGLVMRPPQGNVLCAYDENTQTLHASVWGSSPFVPLSGTMTIGEVPQCPDNPDHWVVSFFDIYLEPMHWEIPFPGGCHMPGEAFQLGADVVFTNPGVDPVSYREWLVVDESGILRPYGDPDHLCIGANVPPVMNIGQAACFTVCHDIYDVIIAAPPGAGQPRIVVTPGCEPPCFSPTYCTPGASTDYVYWFTRPAENWILHFEYSNQFVQPVCYCVQILSGPCSTATELTIRYDLSNVGDYEVQLNWRVSQAGLYRIYSTTMTNPSTQPPSFEWVEEGLLYVTAPGPAQWTNLPDIAVYKNYVVVHDCSVALRR